MLGLPRSVMTALSVIYIVWGSTYFAIHVALISFPPFLLMGTRFFAAGSLLFAWKKWRGTPSPKIREWIDAGVVGVLMLGGGMGLTALAQQSISSGLTAVFIACSPMVLSFCVGFFGDWPNRREWTGIMIGFAGAVMLAFGGEFSAKPIGVISLIGAILSWDIGSVLSQRKLKMAPGAMGFASQMLLGGAFLMMLGFLMGEKFNTPITVNAWIAWSYLVVAGSLLAFTAYMYLLSAVTPALAGSYAYVNPVIAVILGVMLGGEKIGVREMIAITVILGSVILITTARKKTNAALDAEHS
ncbi:drug/metabolite exporter YedA [Undibacterium sp. RTI2.1]|uniref:drug/metabolite exporter YedA n=1 Tax=unclassified Undibacterium TaxID=2630295 RepID=UPI002B22BB32|nr:MULTISPECIES: drug/metabolite exporter YedA [unclassified Undibacterium]MEB0033023.1 drug/metabolite exporter YedA [Undibacterium sp. RTI2.1]MEB0118517.1 drug/metabolite exporter YedA [Undibacterium sp. RTI2.2]